MVIRLVWCPLSLIYRATDGVWHETARTYAAGTPVVAHDMDDHDDANLGSRSNGDVMTYIGTEWVAQAPATSTEPLGDGATGLFDYGSATPSVASGAAVYRSNNGNGQLTNFTGGTDGQRLTVDVRHNLTFVDSTLLSLEGSVDHMFVLGDTVSFVYQVSATTTGWRETSRTLAAAASAGTEPLGDGATELIETNTWPSVASGAAIYTSSPSDIDGFVGAADGQRWTFYASHTMTVASNSYTLLDGRSDFDMVAGDTISFVYRSSGDKVYETGRTYVATPSITPPATQAFNNGDATPSVASGSALYKTTGVTAITTFDDAVDGQTFTVYANDSITLQNSSGMFLAGTADFAMAVGDTCSFVYDGLSSRFLETSRMVR